MSPTIKEGTNTPEPDAAVAVKLSLEKLNKLVDVQNTSHVELSGPNTATGCSKGLAITVGARLGYETSTRLRTVGLAWHAGLPYILRLRTSWHSVKRIPIRALGSPQRPATWELENTRSIP
jgi:hypothetical protein